MRAGPLKRFASETVEAGEPDLSIPTASQRSTGYYLFNSGTRTGVELPVQSDLQYVSVGLHPVFPASPRRGSTVTVLNSKTIRLVSQ